MNSQENGSGLSIKQSKLRGLLRFARGSSVVSVIGKKSFDDSAKSKNNFNLAKQVKENWSFPE